MGIIGSHDCSCFNSPSVYCPAALSKILKVIFLRHQSDSSAHFSIGPNLRTGREMLFYCPHPSHQSHIFRFAQLMAEQPLSGESTGWFLTAPLNCTFFPACAESHWVILTSLPVSKGIALILTGISERIDPMPMGQWISHNHVRWGQCILVMPALGRHNTKDSCDSGGMEPDGVTQKSTLHLRQREALEKCAPYLSPQRSCPRCS